MKKYLPLILALVVLYTPFVADAQRYLVDFNANIDNKNSFDEYINLLYKMSIAAAGLLAVVKIMIAGAKYMLTDVITSKSEAKSDIKGALLGLLLIIGAVIVLETINPQLTDGGLKITQFTKPTGLPEISSLKVGQPVNTEGKTAAEQAAAQAEAAGDPCAKPAHTVVAPSGVRQTVRTDISTCTDKDTVMAKMRADCMKVPGSTFVPGPDNAWVGCAQPIAGAVAVKTFTEGLTMAEVGGKRVPIQDKYVTRAGNVSTVDLGTACMDKARSNTNLDTDDKRSVSYNSCLQTEGNEINASCTANGTFGRYSGPLGTKLSPTTATCELPKDTKKATDFKSSDPNFPNRTLTVAEFQSACKAWGGESKDLEQWGATGSADYVCVKY